MNSNRNQSLVKNVVFDFGGVLIDWNPRHLYRKLLPVEQVEDFLNEVNFHQINDGADRGESLSAVVERASLKFPHRAELLRAYRDRYRETFGGILSASVEILKELKNKGVPLYGLTNWSDETFRFMKPEFPFLDLLDGIVVSGAERIAKPDHKIYRILIERFNLNPSETLFIDDRLENIEAASHLGLQVHHFQSSEILAKDYRVQTLRSEGPFNVAN